MPYHWHMVAIKNDNLDCSITGCGVVLGGGVSSRSSGPARAHWINGSPVHDVLFRGHADTVFNYKTLMKNFIGFLLKWLRRLDAESVSTFQTMYYCLFTMSAVLLIFFPDFHLKYVSSELGRLYYDAWLAINLICPSITLIGRHLTARASRARPGQPNSAYGAAWLQLCGDTGVWGNILVYVSSMIVTGWWSKEIYTFAFLMMGVAGGAMFTARSARRILQIEFRSRRAAHTGLRQQ